VVTKETGGKTTSLDLTVLKCLQEKKSLEKIAHLTKVAPQVLGKEIARLQVDGYVTPEGRLTEKGFKALRTKSE